MHALAAAVAVGISGVRKGVVALLGRNHRFKVRGCEGVETLMELYVRQLAAGAAGVCTAG